MNNVYREREMKARCGNRLVKKILPMLTLLAFTVGLGNCSQVKYIPGTHIPDKPKNREIIKVVEKYRRAMMNRDAGTLMSMAHPHYYEHSGTPKGKDDYGYKGLLDVIKKRMKQLRAMRYNIKYRKIKWVSNKQVEVEYYIDASYQIATPDGTDKWSRYTHHNKIILIKHKDRWLFVRGF